MDGIDRNQEIHPHGCHGPRTTADHDALSLAGEVRGPWSRERSIEYVERVVDPEDRLRGTMTRYLDIEWNLADEATW